MHNDVLTSLSETVGAQNIRSIQITENDCIITMKNQESKIELQLNGFDYNSRHINVVEIEKTITNVTLKDAPCELSDMYISTCMSKYGQVIQGSIRRGTIKDTYIENGTRYLQMLNVKNPIPVVTKLGSYFIRIFCDNCKTECKHCGETSHACFKCPNKVNKEKKVKRCYTCDSDSHLARDCPDISEVLNRMDQSNSDESNNHSYHDNVSLHDEFRNLPEVQPLQTPVLEGKMQNGISEADLKTIFAVGSRTLLIGDANFQNLPLEDDTDVVAQSNASSKNIEDLLKASKDSQEQKYPSKVGKIVINVGTNDISQNNYGNNMKEQQQ